MENKAFLDHVVYKVYKVDKVTVICYTNPMIVTITVQDGFNEDSGEPTLFFSKMCSTAEDAEAALAYLLRVYERKIKERGDVIPNEIVEFDDAVDLEIKAEKEKDL